MKFIAGRYPIRVLNEPAYSSASPWSCMESRLMSVTLWHDRSIKRGANRSSVLELRPAMFPAVRHSGCISEAVFSARSQWSADLPS